MKRIICGTDFSVHAAEAANVAAALAVRRNATLTLVHAVAPHDVQMQDQTTRDVIRHERRRRLIAEGMRLRNTGAEVLEKLVFGTPHEVLVTEARQAGADLIVVASLGEVSAARWLAGSVASRTAQKASVPTLVVRDHSRMLAWARGERPLNLFVCYDFSPGSEAALRWAASFKSWGPCRVTVTYVSWPPQEAWRLGVTGGGAECDTAFEVRALLERGIQEKCGRLFGDVETRIHVVASWGRADVHLNELANVTDADLVVVGANHRNVVDRFWMASVSRGIVRHARTNVACVPAGYVARATEPDGDGVAQRLTQSMSFAESREEADAVAR